MPSPPDSPCDKVPLPTETWAAVDALPDPCIVVTRRMELVHLNEPARSLVPPEWLGRRCWEVFPVGAQSCAAKCPAVHAVTAGDAIEYCEETIWPGGAPVPIGVAVIPLGAQDQADYRAALLLRPRPATGDAASFRAGLLEDAGRLRARLAGVTPPSCRH